MYVQKSESPREQTALLLPKYEGDGIIVGKDGRVIDPSASSVVPIATMIATGQAQICRDPNTKYVFQSNKDPFPEFYDREYKSIEEAEAEIRKHALRNGFEIRLSNIEKDDLGLIKTRRFVCSCEGKRKLQSSTQEATTLSNNSSSNDMDYQPNFILAESQVRRRKGFRCGCPYNVVVKRRQSEFDPNLSIFKVHSVDIFHNHWRDRFATSEISNAMVGRSIHSGHTIDPSLQAELEGVLISIRNKALKSRWDCEKTISFLRTITRTEMPAPVSSNQIGLDFFLLETSLSPLNETQFNSPNIDSTSFVESGPVPPHDEPNFDPNLEINKRIRKF